MMTKKNDPPVEACDVFCEDGVDTFVHSVGPLNLVVVRRADEVKDAGEEVAAHNDHREKLPQRSHRFLTGGSGSGGGDSGGELGLTTTMTTTMVMMDMKIVRIRE
jgi:hypothetical protein